MNREPLTLEQLRELRENSEFVGANVLLEIHGVKCCGVLDQRSDDGICASYSATEKWLKEKDYGKTWLAYAYPPARINSPCQACGYGGKHLDAPPCTTCPAHPKTPVHIDREAWEPCKFCGKADIGEYGFEYGKHYAKIACALGSWRFPKDEQFKFYPNCGKPLTPEAWAELKKRIGVMV